MSQQAVFEADLDRFDQAFRAAGAIRTEPDGYQWTNPNNELDKPLSMTL